MGLAANTCRLVEQRYDSRWIGEKSMSLVEEAVATRSAEAVKQGIGSQGMA